jgi:ankyrin repeat protein
MTSETDKLLTAVQNGSVDAAEKAIEAGANINALDEWGRTPLSHAAGNGYMRLVELLIAKKARVDIRDLNNLTARDWAYRFGAPKIVSMLDAASGRQEGHAEQIQQRRNESGEREID